MSANVFISFASQDRKVALTLCSALENRGFQCWISARDIQPGENFQTAIVKAIRQAKIMLLVFTANSNTSEEMTKELALASQFKVMVVPLRIEDVAPSDAFAYEFATRQWIDFFSDWELAIQQLSRRIEYAVTQPSANAKLSSAAEAAVLDEAIERTMEATVTAPPKVAPPVAKAKGADKGATKIEALFPDATKADSAQGDRLDKRQAPPLAAQPKKPVPAPAAAAPKAPMDEAAAAASKRKLLIGGGLALGLVVVIAIATAVALGSKGTKTEDTGVTAVEATPATPITTDVVPIGPAPPPLAVDPAAPLAPVPPAPGARTPRPRTTLPGAPVAAAPGVVAAPPAVDTDETKAPVRPRPRPQPEQPKRQEPQVLY